jgi:hypothetical protein
MLIGREPGLGLFCGDGDDRETAISLPHPELRAATRKLTLTGLTHIDLDQMQREPEASGPVSFDSPVSAARHRRKCGVVSRSVDSGTHAKGERVQITTPGSLFAPI